MAKKIAVIGAGAAGFFAAIQAATSYPDAQLLLLEGSKKVLSKVLISGGGRCNVTNDTRDIPELLKGYPRGSRELRGPFSRFAVQDTIEWFESRGVKLKTEPDRRMFPITDSSSSVSTCLEQEARRRGVQLKLAHKVTRIKPANKGLLELEILNHSSLQVDAVILASGGNKGSYELARSLGHCIEKPVPSLFTFEIDSPLIAGLSGLSFEHVQLRLKVGSKSFRQEGPLLITHWGLSGPAVIKLSAFAALELFESNYSAKLIVSFSGGRSLEQISELLRQVKQSHSKKQVQGLPQLELPRRFWAALCLDAKIDESTRFAELTRAQLEALSTRLHGAEFRVKGKGVFKEEFVTCGGVKLKEVDFRTMKSKLHPRLSFAGEVLDIDGITGGYNFQNAWTTGWIAGQHCLEEAT